MVHYCDPLQNNIHIIAPWRFTHFLDNFSIFRNFSLKFSKALLNKDIIKRIYLFPTGFDTKSSSGNLNGQLDKNYWKLRSFKLAGTFWYLPTNSGEALNYKSECSEKYKKGVITNLLHRGYKTSSNIEIFNQEINRLKQLLANNNYPMKLVDNYVNSILQVNWVTRGIILMIKLKLKYTTKTKWTASTRRMKKSSKISSNKM